MSFLDTILQDKRDDLARDRAAVSLDALREQTRGLPRRGFRAALTKPGRTAVIAELKGRTPTIERFRQSDSLDALADIYVRGGAAAISIVTDERRFGTSLETVRRIRARVALPILVKDFVIDEYQVAQARAAGADALLLIARMLDAGALTDLIEQVHAIGMEALVEVHDTRDMEKAVMGGAAMIGINNRDLDRMEVSLNATRKLAELAPAGAIIVAESGIHTRADIDDLAAYGAKAFLVGGALLNAADPAAKLVELIGADRG